MASARSRASWLCRIGDFSRLIRGERLGDGTRRGSRGDTGIGPVGEVVAAVVSGDVWSAGELDGEIGGVHSRETGVNPWSPVNHVCIRTEWCLLWYHSGGGNRAIPCTLLPPPPPPLLLPIPLEPTLPLSTPAPLAPALPLALCACSRLGGAARSRNGNPDTGPRSKMSESSDFAERHPGDPAGARRAIAAVSSDGG